MDKRNQKSQGVQKSKKTVMLGILFFLLSLTMVSTPVFAATNTSSITKSFQSIYNIIAAIVTSIGQLYLLWGVFEWATSLNGQDGVGQSMAFKRIAAGLVACMAPTIITMISY